MAELITSPIKNVLYKLNAGIDVVDAIATKRVSLPTDIAGELNATSQKYNSKISDAQNKLNKTTQTEATKQAQTIQTSNNKKKTAKEKRKESKSKKESETGKKLKNFFQAQINNLKTELQKELKEIEEKGKAIKDTFDKFISDTKESYKSGHGKEKVDEACDKINKNYDQIVETSKKISIEIPMMIAKVPTPGAIGPCVTNPGYSVQTMVTDLQTILSLFLIIIGCSKEIKTYIQKLKIDKIQQTISELSKFKLTSLLPDKNIIDRLSNSVKDMDDKISEQEKNINEAQKQMKSSAEGLKQPIYLDNEHNGNSDYIIAYKSVVLYDDLSLKGYNFYYSTTNAGKNYQRNVRINNWLQKNGFKSTSEIPGSKMGEYMGLVHGSLKKVKNLDFWYFLPSNNINDSTVPSVSEELTTATIENDRPKNETLSGIIITLDNGRKIYLDGNYTSGDTIKLSDGTIVTIK